MHILIKIFRCPLILCIYENYSVRAILYLPKGEKSFYLLVHLMVYNRLYLDPFKIEKLFLI